MKNDDLIPVLEIPEIPYPANLVKGLKKIIPKFENSLKTNEIDMDSGYLPFDIRKLKFPQNIQFLMFEWIAENNVIFEILNIILYDFRLLAENPDYFPGNPSKRLTLLIRTFFYEIFRLREVFVVFLKKLKMFNVLNNKDIKEFKYSFGKHFEKIIKIRNKMVHESFSWAGQNFFKMYLVEGAKHFGGILVEKDFSKIYTIKDCIKNIYNEITPSLLVEGHYISEYIKNFIESFSQSMDAIEREIKKRGR